MTRSSARRALGRAGLALALALLVGAGAAGCGDTLDHGQVTGKEDRPAYTSVVLVPIRTGQICGGGKYSSCTPIYVYIPYNVYHPEQFVLDLKACDDAHDDTKCKTGHAYLNQTDWDATSVGDYWDKHPGDRHPNPDVTLDPA